MPRVSEDVSDLPISIGFKLTVGEWPVRVGLWGTYAELGRNTGWENDGNGFVR